MNSSKRILSLGQLAHRQLSTSGKRMNQKIKEIQQKLGVEDNVPVHIKKGFSDRILLIGTTGIITLGLGMSAETIYQICSK